eukprot:scaffold11342_cov114-Isochrysis_galbana.AAC.2
MSRARAGLVPQAESIRPGDQQRALPTNIRPRPKDSCEMHAALSLLASPPPLFPLPWLPAAPSPFVGVRSGAGREWRSSP